MAAIEVSSLCASVQHYGTWCTDFAKNLLFSDEDQSTHGYLFAQTSDKAETFWESVPFDPTTEARTLVFQCVNLLPKDAENNQLYGFEDNCSVRGRRVERVDVFPRVAGIKAKRVPSPNVEARNTLAILTGSPEHLTPPRNTRRITHPPERRALTKGGEGSSTDPLLPPLFEELDEKYE